MSNKSTDVDYKRELETSKRHIKMLKAQVKDLEKSLSEMEDARNSAEANGEEEMQSQISE